MRNIIASSILGAVTAALAAPALSAPLHHPEKPTHKYEKCYGAARAGQNDCSTASTSCAGTTRVDGHKDAWIYLPAGTCAKIVGGSPDREGG